MSVEDGDWSCYLGGVDVARIDATRSAVGAKELSPALSALGGVGNKGESRRDDRGSHPDLLRWLVFDARFAGGGTAF